MTPGPDQKLAESPSLGARVERDGVHFSVYSRNAEQVELLLFDAAADAQPTRVLSLDTEARSNDGTWRVFVPGVGPGQLYAWRVHGPFAPKKGHRFDGEKVLLDPYARAVAGAAHYDRGAASQPGDNCARALKSVVVDPSSYDWEGDEPPRHSWRETVIYELHVGGFTHHPTSGVAAGKRGTYAGLIEKISYLKDLGITAVELLPVHEFDVQDSPPGLENYWGYSPLAFFAPHSGYSSRRDPLGPVEEFRDLVKALHRAGIEVILDVVFNHTSEIGEAGPTVSLRGLDNSVYYLPGPKPGSYANHTGCGNTLNANHPVVQRLILDCLRAWVADMHVDGFRFDLASALTLGEDGEPLEEPPLLKGIAADPVLSRVKLIAEPWEATGLQQTGMFGAFGFAEWNDRFRDGVRRFIRGDNDTVAALGARITGSHDLFGDHDADEGRSINFVTCHDGFTLSDLVSYNEKHNESNGEESRDGTNENHSWNCGTEGPASDPAVEELRQRQIRNFLTLLLLSGGVPMLGMGDEVRRSQAGNNNSYCQNNELSWFNWSAVEQEAGLLRFVQGLLRFAGETGARHMAHTKDVGAGDGLAADGSSNVPPQVRWHGVHLGKPDWGKKSHSLAFTLHDSVRPEVLHILLNMFSEPLEFELLPLPDGASWKRIVDTSLAAPEDFRPEAEAPLVETATYHAAPRSCVVLLTSVKS